MARHATWMAHAHVCIGGGDLSLEVLPVEQLLIREDVADKDKHKP